MLARSLLPCVRSASHFARKISRHCTIAWRGLLRAPWSGLSLADMLRLARASPIIFDSLNDDAVLDTLSEDGRVRCRRLRQILLAAFEVRNQSTLTRWIESTWLALGGPACLASPQEFVLATAVFTRLRTLESRGMPDVSELP